MTSLSALLWKWPLIRQIHERTIGTGLEAMSDKTRAMYATEDALVARSRLVTTRFVIVKPRGFDDAELLRNRFRAHTNPLTRKDQIKPIFWRLLNTDYHEHKYKKPLTRHD